MDPENRESAVTGEKREVYAEPGVSEEPQHSEEELKALALAYAKFLADKGLTPGEPTFAEPEDLEAVPDAEEPEPEEVLAPEADEEPEAAEEQEAGEELEVTEEPEPEEAPEAEAPEKKAVKVRVKKPAGSLKAGKMFSRDEMSEEDLHAIEAWMEDRNRKSGKAAAIVDFLDRGGDRISEAASKAGKDFITAGHSITSTYRQSRRFIGTALLVIGVLAVIVLAIFDRYTVYEYAYNGKILGYVKNQEDVTDVLDIAGTKLSENSSEGTEIKFVANQNVTFNLVDGRGKSLDDADLAVNKLVYMTDIETEAYGIYDGGILTAIVKSNEDAENLLNESMAVLSDPDDGMELVSSEFTNELDIRPVNVLLTSVQSNNDALKMMTEGGTTQYFHIVEAGETISSIAKEFGVDPINIYDDANEEVVTEIQQGDKVCIRKTTEPVSVKMVEEGKMREKLPFETVKKDSADYYEGDTHIEQDGIDGIQIFEGTVTKVSGEVTDRDPVNIRTIREKQDKIILVGTAERPKTAPTGTYAMPIQRYVLTSNFGYRWGRLHSGIDMAAPTGTPIYATDGGTVTKAEFYSGYGNVVFIDHGNGRESRYAHCSALLVNRGDKVYQGQNIALVGNTGHSFGSHLHFEVLFNGTPTNPRPYLGI